MNDSKADTTPPLDLRTRSGISPTLWVNLDFRAWQWGHLLRVEAVALEGKHHWIQPADSPEPQSCEPFEDLRTLLDHCQEGRAGAGLVNLDRASEIDALRDRFQPYFAQGAVWPHSGDRQALENLRFDTSGCRWFTTQITPGDAGENWRRLLKELRLEAPRELVHELHDAVNLLGTFRTARSRLPDAPWTRIAAEIRADYGDGSPDALERQLHKVQSDLQRLTVRTVTPLRLKGNLPAKDLEVLKRLVGSLETVLEAIAGLVDPRRGTCTRDPAATLDTDLATWHEMIRAIGRIQL